jgi:hypothetical protein
VAIFAFLLNPECENDAEIIRDDLDISTSEEDYVSQ